MKKLFLQMVTVASLGLLLAGCGGNGGSKSTGDSDNGSAGGGTAAAGGEIKIGLSSNIASLDPSFYTAAYESNVMRSIYDTLIEYDDTLTNFVPALATEWEVSEDLLDYRFTLRDDVYFQAGDYQDGRLMTAEDVKYSLERSLNESALNRLRYVKAVAVESDTEVVVTLEEPYAGFLAMLTDMGNAIIPQEEVEGQGDKFGSHPVGTGPFTFTEWVADDHVTLEKNEKYWGDEPNLDTVTFNIITDTNMMGNSLQSGDIDIATDIKGQNVELIKANDNLTLEQIDGLSIGYLSFNVADGPTADLKVRQAMNIALDRDELAQGVYSYGEAVAAYLPLPRASWGYSEAAEKLAKEQSDQELDAAKKLLKEAGYGDGFDIELYCSEARVPAATIVQSQMKALGINISIKSVEWGTFSEIVASGKAPLYIMGWSWYPDPDFFLYQMFDSKQIGSLGNGGGYSNEQVDQWLSDATATTTDESERAVIYGKVLEQLVKDLPHLDLYDQDVLVGLNNRVGDYTVRPDGSIKLVTASRNVWVSQD